MSTRMLLLLAGAVAVVWSIRNWRLAVQGAMVLVVVEGALRKWVLPGSQDLIYFAKDFVLLGAYVGFLSDRRRRPLDLPPQPGLYAALGLAALFGAVQVFNPNLPSLTLGILGFRSYFLYAPLLFVLPAAFDDDAQVARFLKWYLLLPIPVGLLAGLQFFSPGGSALNVYARGTADQISSFGTSAHVRVTGTFSYISGYGTYLLASALLLLAVFATVRWQLRGQLLFYAAFAMTLLGMLMTGSRGPVFMLAILFPAYWMLAIAKEAGSAATAGRVVLAATLLGLFLANAAPEAVGAFRGRAEGSSDIGARFVQPFLAPVHSIEDAGALGWGIGATHQAASALLGTRETANWMRAAAPEAESGRVMLELGPVGFVLVYSLRFAVALFAFREAVRMRTRFHRALATAAFMLALVAIPGGIAFDSTAALYYWFFVGLLMLAIRLDRAGVPAAARLGAARSTHPVGRAVPARS